MHLSNRAKGVLVVIGGILLHIITGSVHLLSSLQVYLISYLRIFDNSLKLSDGFFFGPLSNLSVSLSMSLGGYLERRYGPRQITFFGLSLAILGHVIIYFSKNLYIDYGAMLLNGIGVGSYVYCSFHFLVFDPNKT